MIGWETPYYRRKLMDASNNVAAYTTPTTVYFGLTTSVLSESASVLPSPNPECVGNGYARTAFTWDGTFWTPADASGTASNITTLTTFTATASWTVAGVGAFVSDAPTGGNLLIAGAIDIDKLVLPVLGETVAWPPGTIFRTAAAP